MHPFHTTETVLYSRLPTCHCGCPAHPGELCLSILDCLCPVYRPERQARARSPYPKTVPPWMRQIATVPRGCRGARIEREVVHAAWREPGKEGCEANTGLTAFAYLWRRFGPPWSGCDDEKDLVGYILGTPHREIFLHLHLSASPLDYAIGYLMTEAFARRWSAPAKAWGVAFEAWWLAHVCPAPFRAFLDDPDAGAAREAVVRAYCEDRANPEVIARAETVLGPFPRHCWRERPPGVALAITAALIELQRPVYIRDVPVNIFGRVEEDDVGRRQPAPPSPYAGYGMPQAAMEALRNERPHTPNARQYALTQRTYGV